MSMISRTTAITRIDAEGRVELPGAVLEAAGLVPGDVLLVTVLGPGSLLLGTEQALREAGDAVRALHPKAPRAEPPRAASGGGHG